MSVQSDNFSTFATCFGHSYWLKLNLCWVLNLSEVAASFATISVRYFGMPFRKLPEASTHLAAVFDYFRGGRISMAVGYDGNFGF